MVLPVYFRTFVTTLLVGASSAVALAAEVTWVQKWCRAVFADPTVATQPRLAQEQHIPRLLSHAPINPDTLTPDEVYVLDSGFRIYVRRTFGYRRGLPQDPLMRAHLLKAYRTQQPPQFDVLSPSTYRNVGTLRHYAVQYFIDVMQTPARLVFAPHDPSEIKRFSDWRRHLVRTTHYLDHGIAEWRRSYRQLAVIPSVVLWATVGWGAHEFRTQQTTTYESQLVDVLTSHHETLVPRATWEAGLISTKAAKDFARLITHRVDEIEDIVNGQSFISEDVKTRFERSTYWQPMISLRSLNFFADSEDYEIVLNAYLNYRWKLSRYRASGQNALSRSEAQKQLFLPELISRLKSSLGDKYPVHLVFALTGFGTGTIDASTVRFWQLWQSQDSLVRELLGLLPTSQNPFYDFAVMEALAAFRAHPNQSLPVVEQLREHSGISQSLVVELQSQLLNVWTSPDLQTLRSKRNDFEDWLSTQPEIPGVLAPILLNAFRKDVPLDTQVIVYTHAERSPRILRTRDELLFFAATQFEFATLFQGIRLDAMNSTIEDLQKSINAHNIIRQHFSVKGVPSPAEALEFLERHHLYRDTLKHQDLSVEEQRSLAMKLISLQMTYYHMPLPSEQTSWQYDYAFKAELTSRMLQSLLH
jgi:hypothetical protein